VPGDLFREYRWFHEKGDAGQSIRVGGKQGESHPDRGSDHGYINAPMQLPHDLDLDGAVKAEVVLEKVLCHDGTTGLAVQINDSDWYYVPESGHIPAPQASYQHHTYPVVRVPLSAFKSGANNSFRLRVDPEHPWRWPQNLINGLHVRIYYDAETNKQFVFLTNNFTLPALTVTELYRSRWQVELFFKWIKQHLRIKSFFGTSENAVKTQVWIAVSVYLLVAIIKKRLNIEASLYSILQILSLTVFETTPMNQLLTGCDKNMVDDENHNQLNLF